MIGYLLVCFVDTEVVSHNKKKVDEIISFINRSNIIAHDFTFLFKNNDFNTSVFNFQCYIPEFLNDPLYIEDEEWDEDEDLNEVEMLIQQSKSEEEAEVPASPYEDDYISIFIQFVTSEELFKAFCDKSEKFDIYNCNEFYFYPYVISSLDQMEILRRIQRPQTDEDKIDEILLSKGKKRKNLLRILNNRNKN